jgi:ribosome biogenesis GTPase
MKARSKASEGSQSPLQTGLIVANYGRHFLVEADSGERRICHSRGKKSQGVVGDRVLWQASQDEGTIERIEARHNLFYRQDEVRTKSFAANLDRVLILIAAEPEFSSSQLSRALIAAEEQHITPIIALNKSDLVEPFARAWDWLAPYRQMGYDVLPLALKQHTDADRTACCSAVRPHHAGAGTFGCRQKHADQHADCGRAGADRRLVAGAQCRQTHHHQHHAVLGG